MILLSVILLTEVEIHQSQSGANENQELPRGEAFTPTARRREVSPRQWTLTQNDWSTSGRRREKLLPWVFIFARWRWLVLTVRTPVLILAHAKKLISYVSRCDKGTSNERNPEYQMAVLINMAQHGVVILLTTRVQAKHKPLQAFDCQLCPALPHSRLLL